jgi:hypothetical protein
LELRQLTVKLDKLGQESKPISIMEHSRVKQLLGIMVNIHLNMVSILLAF